MLKRNVNMKNIVKTLILTSMTLGGIACGTSTTDSEDTKDLELVATVVISETELSLGADIEGKPLNGYTSGLFLTDGDTLNISQGDNNIDLKEANEEAYYGYELNINLNDENNFKVEEEFLLQFKRAEGKISALNTKIKMPEAFSANLEADKKEYQLDEDIQVTIKGGDSIATSYTLESDCLDRNVNDPITVKDNQFIIKKDSLELTKDSCKISIQIHKTEMAEIDSAFKAGKVTMIREVKLEITLNK